MFEKLMICCFLLSFFNIANAEIIQVTNNFDNSKIITSYFSKGSNDNNPKDITLRKTLSPTSHKYQFFIFRGRSANRVYTNIDNIKFKFDNDVTNISEFPTTLLERPGGYIYSIDITAAIDKIKNSNSITIQQPLYTLDSTYLRYTYYELDKNILAEWKQVIAME